MRIVGLVNLHYNKTMDTSKQDKTLLTVEGIMFHGFGPE